MFAPLPPLKPMRVRVRSQRTAYFEFTPEFYWIASVEFCGVFNCVAGPHSLGDGALRLRLNGTLPGPYPVFRRLQVWNFADWKGLTCPRQLKWLQWPHEGNKLTRRQESVRAAAGIRPARPGPRYSPGSGSRRSSVRSAIPAPARDCLGSIGKYYGVDAQAGLGSRTDRRSAGRTAGR